MANLGGVFDANTVEPTAPREIIPAGKYVAQVVRSDVKETKSGTGQLLELEFDILDGEYANRKLWARLNIVNQNPQAQEIAQRDLSALCRAAGQMQISDSEALHFKPVLLTVKVRPAGPDKQGVHREAQNEIGGYEAAPGSAPRAAAPVSRPAAPAPAKPAASAPPWKRTAA